MYLYILKYVYSYNIIEMILGKKKKKRGRAHRQACTCTGQARIGLDQCRPPRVDPHLNGQKK